MVPGKPLHRRQWKSGRAHGERDNGHHSDDRWDRRRTGYSGDGGLATQALLANPSGLAFDGDHALYISDSGNSAIRKVDLSTGIITTVAGTGVGGFSGDGGPASRAN